ncbi:Signal transduction histidine kinase [Halopseudomonas sabulinigri]|uniref:histidine kinase n=1 Tax=Halopseudomonas sabulinigri TaxID=472181 RepID=A0A1H1P7M1_9GAMM|nr:sensor histidine kinase [Halopseudomonas sabulinigri]SDS07288.1 Signal transduction histidine kinase [Halopseudomonas sabulinigri]
MISIGRRLGVSLLLIMLCSVLLIGQGSVWLYDRAQRSYLMTLLQGETDSLLAAMTPGSNGLYLDLGKVNPDYRRPYSGRYFIVEGRERWRSRSLWDTRLSATAITDKPTTELVPGPKGQQLLVWSQQYRSHGEQLIITVALDYQPLLLAFKQARWWLWGLGGAVIGIALMLQQGVLLHALRPLRRTRRELAEWRSGERLQLSESVPLELQPLVTEINHLGRQIERVLERSRSSAGDLGHALKTPLAVLESRLDNLSSELPPAQLLALQEQLDLMHQQLERTLQRARLAPEQQRVERFHSGTDLPPLIATLQSLYPQRDIQLRPQPDASWPYDREDMQELLGNLLDNACKFSQARVEVRWRLDAEGLLLQVADDGPGIAPEARAGVLERGTRLDQQVPGHGLGLGIVLDLVQAYAGKLTLSEAELGGLLVEVRLPLRARLEVGAQQH